MAPIFLYVYKTSKRAVPDSVALGQPAIGPDGILSSVRLSPATCQTHDYVPSAPSRVSPL